MASHRDNTVSDEEIQRRRLELREYMLNQPPVHLDPQLTDPRHSDYPDLPRPTNEERLANTDWCSCGKCLAMPTTEESICCQEVQKVKEKLNEGQHCICDDLYVHQNLVDREHLIHLYRYGLSFQRRRFRSVEQMDDGDFRKTACRAFTMWLYGYLGPRRRRPIPACVVRQIREAFSSPTITYTGLVYASADGNAVDFFLYF